MSQAALLEVRVLPGAKNDAVEGTLADGRIKIRLRARAVEGAANEALVEFVAERLGVARRAVRILRGERSRMKTLEVDGLGPREARDRLAGGADAPAPPQEKKRPDGK